MDCNLIHSAEKISGARFLPPTGLSVNMEIKTSQEPSIWTHTSTLLKNFFKLAALIKMNSLNCVWLQSWQPSGKCGISDALFLMFSISPGPFQATRIIFMSGTAITGLQVPCSNVLRQLISSFISLSGIIAFILVYSREIQRVYAFQEKSKEFMLWNHMQHSWAVTKLSHLKICIFPCVGTSAGRLGLFTPGDQSSRSGYMITYDIKSNGGPFTAYLVLMSTITLSSSRDIRDAQSTTLLIHISVP